MWEFLSDPENRTTIGFYAGGVAAVVAGLWRAWLSLRKKPEGGAAKAPPSRQVSGGDGVTAGGDVMIEGGVTFTRNELPKGAVALIVLGIALVALGAYMAGGGDHLEQSIKVGGDLKAGTITIGAPSAGGD